MAKRSAVRAEFLGGVLITAIEGGINYWASVDEYHVPGDDYGKARAVIIDHAEGDGSGERFTVTVDTVARGIRRVLADDFRISPDIRREIREGNAENDAGIIDAIGADCIVQAALFGRLIYG